LRLFILKHAEKIRFLVVGGINTLFGFCCFLGLNSFFGTPNNYLIILAIATFINITYSFLNLKLFVFKTDGSIKEQYFKIWIVYLAVFLINLICLKVLVGVIGFNVEITQGVLTVALAGLSYIIHKAFTFNASLKEVIKGTERFDK